MEIKIPDDVVRRLGYYVYAYVNPLDGRIFYVGKGKGRRLLSHLQDRAETRKVAILRQIRSAGKEPKLEILAHGLGTAENAFRVEAAVIDALGIPALTNRVRGWRSSLYGRTPTLDTPRQKNGGWSVPARCHNESSGEGRARR